MNEEIGEIILTEGSWEAIVHLKGAELRQLRNTATKQDYLWHGGEPWKRVSPILFPFIDKLPLDTYQYAGKSYINKEHSSHGFARDVLFKKHGTPTSTEATFVLESTEAIKEWFPFVFELYVTYRLAVSKNNVSEKARIFIDWEVKNKEENKTMYFSIGGHPALQIAANTRLTDYELVVENELDIESRKEKKRFLTNYKTVVARCTNTFIMPITESILSHGCIVLENMNIRTITLQGKSDVPVAKDFRVQIDCTGFPVVALWAEKKTSGNNEWAQFFCLEPWYGIGALEDTQNQECDVKDKPQIVQLAPGNSFNATYSIGIMA